jgi:hypothetical protein
MEGNFMKKLLLSVLLLPAATQTTCPPQNTFLSVVAPVSAIIGSGIALWMVNKISIPSEDETLPSDRTNPTEEAPFVLDYEAIVAMKARQSPWSTEKPGIRKSEELCLKVLKAKKIIITCPICTESKEQDNTSVKILPCRHILCEGCYEGSIRHTSQTCPVCRTVVDFIVTGSPRSVQSALAFAAFWLEQIRLNRDHLQPAQETTLEETTLEERRRRVSQESLEGSSIPAPEEEGAVELPATTEEDSWKYHREQAWIGFMAAFQG